LVLSVMIMGRLTTKTMSPFWKTLSLTFLLKAFEIEPDKTQYIVEPVTTSSLAFQALKDVNDGYLHRSSWLQR